MESNLSRPKADYRALVFSISLVIAFLGANPFADAVGFPREDSRQPQIPVMLRIACGFVVFLASCTAFRFLINLTRSVIDRLAAGAGRPDRWLALASIICGTVCLLASLQAIFAANYFLGGPAPPTMTFNTGASMPQGSFHMVAGSRSSPALTLVGLLTFLAGVGLLAFGVWGSLKPAAIPAPPAKPDGWGEPMIDAART